MERSQIEQVLEGSELFKGLARPDLHKISSLCTVQNYKNGEYVFRQGDFGDHIYIIAEGHIFLERTTDLGTRKGRFVIGALGRGRIFGCWSTLLNEPHILMSSAACQKPTRVMAIRGIELRKMMAENVELGFNILERLSHVLRSRIQDAYGAMEKI